MLKRLFLAHRLTPPGMSVLIVRTMRIYFFLTFCCVVNLYATGYPQKEKLSFTFKDATLSSIIKTIEKQTDYHFLYNDEDVQNAPKVSIEVKNATVLQILKQCFANFPLQYKIVNKTVVILEAQPQKIPTFEWEEEDQDIQVTGLITDSLGAPLQGVTIYLQSNVNIGTTTDQNGRFILRVPDENAVLVISMVGFITQEISVGTKRTIEVTLMQAPSELDEVVAVAYGSQKKSSMVASITTINPKELKGPTGNLTTMLQGQLAGMIAYRTSGEPGRDNASFFIRGIGTFGSGKRDPLIMIDGMESTPTDLARLQPDDIAAFSILKDATASALFGARGANGVMLITTKSGKEGKMNFNFRMENSLSSNTQNIKLADNITYMELANEAVATRSPMAVRPYTQSKIDYTAAGRDPYFYPNNDWIDILMRDYTLNQRFNFNMTGGGKVAQYYIAGTYNIDNGLLQSNVMNAFNNNIKLRNYQLRSNVTINLTPSTKATVRTSAQFDDYTGPIGGGANVFQEAISANPVMFPAYYPSELDPIKKHPMFGNAWSTSGSVIYNNPYANLISGFQTFNTSTVNVQAEIQQNFGFLLKGLTGRVMAYTQRYSFFDVSRKYSPFYYTPTRIDRASPMELVLMNNGLGQGVLLTDGTEYLNWVPGSKSLNTTTYMESALNYGTTIGDKHDISGMVIYMMRNYLNATATDIQSSLPRRNQGVSGRFGYGYDKRYLFEFDFGYNGSERFAKNNRYGFFPSVGLGWHISNEKFFDNLSRTITSLKLRLTHGIVGNDQIGNLEDRFFYLSNVNVNDGERGATFGTNWTYTRPGVSISRYQNDLITWETSKQTNLGVDLSLFDNLKVVADFYMARRSSILMSRAHLPSFLGLNAPVQANKGEAKSHGIDLSIDYTKSFQNSMWLRTRGTLTYAVSKLLVNEEPDYPNNLYYLSKVGNSLGQIYGLIAERLFIDDKDALNSPDQSFGQRPQGGDIKYRDIDGDGKITNLDIVPIGYPATPELIFGFGFSFGYKSFDLSAFFQGSARSSFLVDPKAIAPFIMAQSGSQTGLLNVIANSHWSERNQDIYAFWPRLSYENMPNNEQPSTWWLRNGSFLRLKTAELGYNLPKSKLDRWKLNSLRVYLNGSDLLLIASKFKLWDPELAGNGLGYPLQRVINLGVLVGL